MLVLKKMNDYIEDDDVPLLQHDNQSIVTQFHQDETKYHSNLVKNKFSLWFIILWCLFGSVISFITFIAGIVVAAMHIDKNCTTWSIL